MTSVLLTAFEPYDLWKANSSWLALVKLTQDLPGQPELTTRLYPVDFAVVRERLASDLAANHDFAIHLGQQPGATAMQLESIAINLGGSSRLPPEQFGPLVEEGPVAYRSPLPLGSWAERLREAGIPAQISYHAGTFLCNATLYYSCYLAEQMALKTAAAFVHLPLDVTQTAEQAQELPALPADTAAEGLRIMLRELAAGV